MSTHIHIHLNRTKAKDARSDSDIIKKHLEKLIRSRKEVRSIGSWSGNELKVELEDISNGKDERAYIKFEINDAGTKYRIVSTLNGFKDLQGQVFAIPGKP